MHDETTKPVRVLLFADGIDGWGLQQLIQSASPAMAVAGLVPRLEDVAGALASGRADVLLIDDIPPDDAQLVDVVSSVLPVPSVLLTSESEDQRLFALVLAGLRGIVRRQDPPDMLVRAVHTLAAGEVWFERSFTARVFQEFVRRQSSQEDSLESRMIRSLTPRERQTVAAIARDTAAPGKVIADRLAISEHTLRNHLTSVYSKLGVSNRLDLYAFVVRHQLDEAPRPIRTKARSVPMRHEDDAAAPPGPFPKPS